MFTTEQLNTALDGRYAIERRIGEGGMAIVYLARDLRHDRRVALKVLRPDLGAIVGEERFLAEIRVTANLQHPNLLPLFDSGAADGVLFYVMPYVEGESLRARIDREKQLPVDEAIRITVAIAGALAHAHAQGIIHRDLKPENILLQAGQPVIADFGIALAVSNAGGARITQTGLSLGTPMYMSPEQATGDRSIDGRTDLYSLAAMTYEMLTGEAPHTGTSSQAIIAKLMTENPRPLTTLRRSVPPHVNAAVLHALEKVPADRFSTPLEFAQALTTPGAVPLPTATGVAAAAAVPAARPASWRGLVVAALAGAVVTGGAAYGWLATRREVTPVSRVHLAFPEQARPSERTKYALSADGSTLVYRGDDSAGQAPAVVWVKTRAEAVPRVLIPRLVSSFALSRDGSWLAYVEGNRLYRVSTTGGAGVPLADSIGGVIGWGDDGALFFWQGTRREGRLQARLVRLPSEGGSAVSVLTLPDSLQLMDAGSLLPGAKGLLIAHCPPASGGCLAVGGTLYAISTSTGELHRISAGAIAGWYLPTGDVLVLRRDGVLLRQPFDLASQAVRGNPTPVVDSIGIIANVAGRAFPQMAVSEDGSLVATIGASGQTLGIGGLHRLVWVDRTGRMSPVDTGWTFRLTFATGNVGWAISPDGKRVVIGENRQLADNIWVKELKPNGIEARLTTDTAAEYRPRWSPDGRFVTYHRSTGMQALYARPADGTGADSTLLAPARLGVAEHAWSPDGRWLVFRRGGSGDIVGGRDIWIKGTGADSTPRPLIADPKFDEAAMSVSPDGKWIAFESNETGVREVYVRPFPNADGGKWKVSNGGAHAALWAKNGRELYFVTLQRDLMAAPLRATAKEPGLGAPVKLFHLPDALALREDENYTPFDVARDGRFLMAERVGAVQQAAPVRRRPVLYVEHWLDELRGATARPR